MYCQRALGDERVDILDATGISANTRRGHSDVMDLLNS